MLRRLTDEQVARLWGVAAGEPDRPAAEMLDARGGTGQVVGGSTRSRSALCALLSILLVGLWSGGSMGGSFREGWVRAAPARRSVPGGDGRSLFRAGGDRTMKLSKLVTLMLPAVSIGAGTAVLAQSDVKYVLFDSSVSTIEVLGATDASSASGYTIECRLFLTGPQPNAAVGFPATVFFEHQASVKHRWLGFSSGLPTGYVASATDPWGWYDGSWILGPTTLPIATWHHLAYVVQPGLEAIYVDGTRVAVRSRGSAVPITGPGSAHIGAGYQSDAPRVTPSFAGYLDWIRVSSLARYMGAQIDVPHESDLSPDASTELLCTFNGQDAADSLRDLSARHVELRAGTGVPGATPPKLSKDCNGDDIPDSWQLATGTMADENANGIPDACETSITGVVPPSVPAQGGALLAIKGNNFPESPVVSIGGVSATDVVRLSPIRLTARTPALSPGMASVTVNGFTLSEALYVRPVCGSDLDQDGAVGGGDLAILLLDWGQCYNSPSLVQESVPDFVSMVEPVVVGASLQGTR